MADNDQTIPDLYVDQSIISVGVFGTAITFSLAEPHPSQGAQPKIETKVHLRMSLEHAKVVAMLLKRQLKLYERQNDITIELPANVYTGLGIPSEDWQMLMEDEHLPQSFASREYNITTHGLTAMLDDQITVEVLEETLAYDRAEIIDQYADTGRGPSCLVLAWIESNGPLHVCIGYGGTKPAVVTVYRPDYRPNIWTADFRGRRA